MLELSWNGATQIKLIWCTTVRDVSSNIGVENKNDKRTDINKKVTFLASVSRIVHNNTQRPQSYVTHSFYYYSKNASGVIL